MPRTLILNLPLHHHLLPHSHRIMLPLKTPTIPPPPRASSLSKAKAILTAASKLAESVITNAPNTAVDQAKKARDHQRDISLGLSPSNRADDG